MHPGEINAASRNALAPLVFSLLLLTSSVGVGIVCFLIKRIECEMTLDYNESSNKNARYAEGLTIICGGQK